MPAWWETEAPTLAKKAVAYYRHSAQDRQENSIPIQREQVRKFAEENGIQIIREFADHGKSGLSTEGRDAFNEMLRDYIVGCKEEFDYVLVLDVSRWGRFQDMDMSAYYVGYCRMHGKQVIFTTIGFAKEDDLTHFLHLSLERYRAASYSRELSGKVFKGCLKIAEQGFRAGGMAPYGLHRLLLDEQRRPVQVLKPGQKKSIQNQRVTLAPGDRKEVAVVRRIFSEFVKRAHPPERIAASLNDEGVPSPGGKRWSSGTVRAILTNELYVGTMVYNKTQQKMQSPSRLNPQEQWVRQEDAFKGIVGKALFAQAQKALEARKAEHELRYSAEDMLQKLARLHRKYGKVGAPQISAQSEMVSPSAYVSRFLSLDMAYQDMFRDALDRARRKVADKLAKHADQVREVDDFLVLDDSFSLLIQPSVPIMYGYEAYWSFRPDPRKEVDITLGVPLSDSGRYDILGYLVFPRMLVGNRSIRLFSSSEGRLGLHGYCDLEMVEALLE